MGSRYDQIRQSLPTGTVAFLFTDIEDSTSLAQKYPEALPALFARHHSILEQSILSQNGYIFRIIGDAFCAAFHTTLEAVQAALFAQRSLQEENWQPAPVLVRMGIHTGAAQATFGEETVVDYQGYLTLAHVQRVMSSAYGGQILLSGASAELVRGQLPLDVNLQDLGEHHLKGLTQQEHLWQIIAPGLISDFPPLPSLNAIPSNLPITLTSFIGRERETKEIIQLLSNAHLITLIGPGGTGKTRLSLKAAVDVLDQFTDGVWLVELASLSDSALVPQTVFSALGVREQPGRPILAQLTDYLRPKKLLLVLDNCEHLITACAQLADALLRVCPHLRLLASSREALGIDGEISYMVPPLQIPSFQEKNSPSQLMQYESVRLFVERAQTTQPRFSLNEMNAGAVAQICRQLDGIPLAIELAAARIKIFTPDQIASRLDDRFRLLTGGSRTALPRQQTLRALIDWSYDLLSGEECKLLRRLSVFAGGWTYGAAEIICAQMADQEAGASVPLDVLEALAQLVNKSLVVADDQADETRYHFLETIRQFAQEKLLESGETREIYTRHLEYYLALAKQAEQHIHSPEQLKWFDLLEAESDNFRVALDWALKNGQTEKELDLSGALWWFWYTRDHFAEARERLGIVYTPSGLNTSDEARLKVMIGLGFIEYASSNLSVAQAILEEATTLSRRLGNRRMLAESLQYLGAVEYARSTTSNPGSLDDIRSLLEESIAYWRELGDPIGISWGLNLLASVAQAEGDLTKARALWEESVALRRIAGDRILLAYSLRRLADIALQQGDHAVAESQYREGHQLLVETGGKAAIAASLVGFGGLALNQGDVNRAVRLYGAVQAILEALNWRLPPADAEVYERDLEMARAQLSEEEFNHAWSKGSAMSIEQSIAYALGNEDLQ